MDAASLGERELDVMTVLWQRKQRAEQRRALRRLIDTLFLGSPEALLSQLVDDHAFSPAELRRIAKKLRNGPGKEGAR